MDGTALVVLAVHILGFTFWIGGLFTVALLMSAAGDEPTVRAKVGAIARRVAIATDAAAGIAMVGGITLLVMRSWDLHQPWMHMKLTFVVGLLAVHGIVRVRAKKLAGGGPTPKPIAAFAVVALALAIVVLAVFKPMAH
jgi:putative membrane protein